MRELIDEAKQYIQREIQNKKDVFVKLCSLNLLNAAIKDKEYKKELSYGYIKPCVSRLVRDCREMPKKVLNFSNELIDNVIGIS